MQACLSVGARPIADFLGLWIVADDANFVAFKVFEVSRIVVLVVFRPQTWAPVRYSSAFERKTICVIDICAMAYRESDHLTVSCVMRIPVVRRTNEKQRTGLRMRLPSSPRSRSVAEAKGVTHYLH